MPELRHDPIIGRWVIISTDRAKRPSDFVEEREELSEKPCPFCEGEELQTPPEIFAIRKKGSQANGPGWEVRVVSSVTPLFHIEGGLNRRGRGLYDMMDGIGAHEIIVETPQHIANIADLEETQITKVISGYLERVKDLEGDQRFKYVLMFKNYGYTAGGSTVKHARSQLIAMPVNPKRVKEELAGSKRYFDYHERCIFCDIIRQEREKGERIVVDADNFVALAPFASRFPFEIWILPKTHSCDFISLSKEQMPNLAHILKLVLMKLGRGLNDPPYNYILHTAPFRRVTREGYWKTIDADFHWHIEIMPRLTRVAGFEWGSGFYICPTPPEDAAAYLREVKV